MRLKAVVMAMALCGLALPASAQIIATSIPRAEGAGKGKAAGTEERFAFHIMGSPLAKWNFGELYLDYSDVIGTIHSTPNSNFLFAAEAVLAAGSDFSIGVGGWYNKIGSHEFDFSGRPFDQGVYNITGNIYAVLDTDIKTYEGHVGLFYKDFGVQGGIVNTTGSVGPNGHLTAVHGQPATAPFTLEARPDAKTTDWDLFGVYKHSFGSRRTGSTQVGLSVGAGMYRKQGVTGSPLRSDKDLTVFSGFATLNLDLYKGLGIDVSYWYVAKTDADTPAGPVAGKSQSRFTVGVGYTFSL